MENIFLVLELLKEIITATIMLNKKKRTSTDWLNYFFFFFTWSAGAVEYTDCTSAEAWDHQ